jgi:hypothetical protein
MNAQLITAEAVAHLQELALQAMRAARCQVLSERAEAAGKLATAHAEALAQAPARAAEIIAKIPAMMGHETKRQLERPFPIEGFDCRAMVMSLDPLDSEEEPGYLNDRRREKPDPKLIHYAARLVWDFCEASGLHPELGRCRAMDGCADQACFCIRIYWNIPDELKAA